MQCGTLGPMRIVVCVKHVPDLQSDRRFEEGTIVRGEDDVLNELDENAIEAAVTLKEDLGGEVIALTMGPADAEDALMRALQMGADRALLVSDDRIAGADGLGTAHILAAAISHLADENPIDLVITGMASLDGQTSLLPAALAAALQRPFLGLAHNLSVDGDGPWTVTISRSADGVDEVLQASTPALVSVTDQANEPRYPAFAAMKAARSKPLDEVDLDDLADYLPGDPETILAATTITDAHARERSGPGTIITDTGDAGQRLAAYILSEVK